METKSRNTTVGFARRTKRNPKYIKQSFDCGEDVHVVAHVVNSLLGIVVVPQQRFPKALWSITLEELGVEGGFPKWNITWDKAKPKTKTLAHLLWHLRNATAHGNFEFRGEPDSRYVHEVRLTVKDKPPSAKEFNWRAEIGGEELYQFCLMLADYIDELELQE